jgi:hypothetical protein
LKTYRLIRRASGFFYAVERRTCIQTNLKTKDRLEALRLLNAKNEPAAPRKSICKSAAPT